MGGQSQVRKPDKRQLKILQEFIDSHDDAMKLRRAEILVMFASGVGGREIAKSLGIHENTVYGALRAFSEQGVASVITMSKGGTAPRLTKAQRAEIVRIANLSPKEFRLPFGRWTLTTLRSYLIRHRVVSAISKEHVRRVLKKGASDSGTRSENSLGRTRGGPPF